MEGIANAQRHSAGAHIRVAVHAEPRFLHIRVDDDGVPPETYRPGVGVSSMRERAEELGGHFTAGPSATGWRVAADLPIA